MAAKRSQEAVALYEGAVALRPNSAEAHYNLGRAYYRLGDFSRALDGFERAARLQRKGRLAAMARYNAGHCLFQQGLALVYGEPQTAVGLLEQSLASLQESVRLDVVLRSDAMHNADVVKKWLQLIQQQIAQHRTTGAGAPGSGPGPAIDAILGQDKGVRSAGGAKVRPMTAGKDW